MNNFRSIILWKKINNMRLLTSVLQKCNVLSPNTRGEQWPRKCGRGLLPSKIARGATARHLTAVMILYLAHLYVLLVPFPKSFVGLWWEGRGEFSEGHIRPLPKESGPSPPKRFEPPTCAHMDWQTATKFCIVIKLHEWNSFARLLRPKIL